jgi:predicted ATPase
MAVEVHIAELEMRNVQVFAGSDSAGNHCLNSILGFLAAAAQQPFEERHVRFGEVHRWIAEHTGLNCDRIPELVWAQILRNCQQKQ